MEIVIVAELIDVRPALDCKLEWILNARVTRVINHRPLYGLFQPLNHRMGFSKEVGIQILGGELPGGLICI